MPVGPEHRLTDEKELLFRQASPAWVQDGQPTSQLFRPMPKDHGLLSVDREAVIGSAQASRARFLARKFNSDSAWAVSVGEVNAEQLEAYADKTKQNDAHALIDMSALDDKQQRGVSRRLLAHAMVRGKLA